MTDGLSGWRRFDVESDILPPDLSPSLLPDRGAGRIVVVAATPFARSRGWAERAVVSLAGGWAREGLRIFLMDLGLDAPALHEALDLPNGEGVSDAFLYGASVQRIAQPALEGSIYFASAGTVTVDPEQVLTHPRWNDLAEGFTEADATLLLFLPTSVSGASNILAQGTDVLFLAGRIESPQEHLGLAAAKRVATLGKEGGPDLEPEESPRFSGADGGLKASSADGAGEIWDFSDADPPGMANELSAFDLQGRGEGESAAERPMSLAPGFLQGLRDESPEVEEGGSAGEGDSGETEGTVYPDEFVLDDDEPAPPRMDLEAGGSDGEPGGSLQDTAAVLPSEGAAPRRAPDFEAEFAEMPDLRDDADTDEVRDDGGDFLPGSGFVPDEHGSPAGEPDLPDGDGTDADRIVSDASSEAPPSGPTPPEPTRTSTLARRRRPTRRRPGASIVVVGGLFVVLLLAALGTAAGVLSVPGFRWTEGLFGDVPFPPLDASGPQPVNQPLAFSLELDAFGEGERDLAVEMRNTLRQRLPDLVFNLTPLSRSGGAAFVLLAGPAVTRGDLESLRARVGEVLFREDPSQWTARATPRAFLLGETGTLEEAQETLASAEAGGVLGYVLQVDYPDGQVGYRILSGAFQGVEEARYWQLVLRDAGYREVPLIERRGRPPE